ncbi:hypothetical protein PGT21_019769 [Puccinia graminis f. sp. tritici]|uniref:Uncharacterized protein n=1 Tax=Puccinia graminis f. sp. tritici TaxID=56615 RepID=A0A5B0NGA6_PUCGR|nr:hypothetical protein PGT21_019769 [Puccinia graminis f. sp. tritici]
MSYQTSSAHDSAMDTGSSTPSTNAPSTVEITNTLRSLELCIAGLQERTEGAVQPIAELLHKIEEELGNIQEQLAHVTHPSQGSGTTERNAERNATNIFNPPEMPVERITTFNRYIPVFLAERVPAAQVHYIEALNNLSFEDKLIMSSVTIERNELYQDAYLALLQVESELLKESIASGAIAANITNRDSFLYELFHIFNDSPEHKRAQDSVLRLRLKRYRVKEIADTINTFYMATTNEEEAVVRDEEGAVAENESGTFARNEDGDR